jgi:hypothetical protein
MGLEHLRFGEQNPVRLVEIEKNDCDGSDLSWVCTSPHMCGKDRYALKLVVKICELNLVWTINGPVKNQISTICYT